MRTLIAAIVLSVLAGATFYYVACRRDKIAESKYYNTAKQHLRTGR